MRKKQFLILFLLISFSADLFSQGDVESRLRMHVKALTADSLKGRAAGTKGESIAADYIYKTLTELDVTNLYNREGQDFSFVSEKGDTIKSRNIVAVIEGYDPALKNEFVLIGAHYDCLGQNRILIDGKETYQTYRGADANASGVATLLEVARQIRSESFNFKRSVIIAAFGAGEPGQMGSWYFVNRAFKYIDKVELMINLDMVGRSGGENFPQVYTLLPGVELSTILRDVSDLPAMISPKITATDFVRSDHQSFGSAGIPVAFVTTGRHRDDHTIRDLPENLDYKGMSDIARYVLELAKSAANLEKPLPKTILSGNASDQSTGKGNTDKIYATQEVDQPPTFLRGDQRQFLDKWVYDYLKYPKSAINQGIQGRVIVEFIVEKNGEVSSVEVSKSVDDALDAEAVKVVKASPKWKAGIKGGVPVRVKLAVPIEFKLKK